MRRQPDTGRTTPLLAALALACAPAGPSADPGMVAEWMHQLYGMVRTERLSPPVASRLLGYASVALYQGLAAVDPSLPPLTATLTGSPEFPSADDPAGHDATLVAVEAERVVLDSLLAGGLPTTRAALARLADSLRDARIALGVAAEIRTRSADLGARIGNAVVAWSRTDGFEATRGRPYAPPVGPGLWVNDTPTSDYTATSRSGATQSVALDNPANQLRAGAASDRDLILGRPKPAGQRDLPAANPAGATEPFWGTLRPFVLRTWDECPLPPPPPYDRAPGSPLHQEAMAVVETMRGLTDEQRQITLYWADNPGETGTPAGHWLAIGGQMVSQRGLTAAQAARLFVATATAQADAFIAGWGYKYEFNLIRPRTYIRRLIDPAWEPLIPTPPFPEYPSGHSTQSAAAASVLTALLGTVAFDDSTGLYIGHPVRRFPSFDAAAEEAGLSRIYGGLHFPVGNTGGQDLGRCIGATVIARLGGTAFR